MSSTIRDATMLLTACLLYVALTSGFANACLLIESRWVTAESAVALCGTGREGASVAFGWQQSRLW